MTKRHTTATPADRTIPPMPAPVAIGMNVVQPDNQPALNVMTVESVNGQFTFFFDEAGTRRIAELAAEALELWPKTDSLELPPRPKLVLPGQ